jgi:hypothetical protein
LLQVVDDVLGQRPLAADHFELQIGSLAQDQQLEIEVEVLTQVPLGTALREDTDFRLESAHFESLNIGRGE